MSNVENQAVNTAQGPDNACAEQINAKYAKRCICVFLGIIVFGTAYVMLSTSIHTPGLAFLLSLGAVVIFAVIMAKMPAESFINNNAAPINSLSHAHETTDYYEDRMNLNSQMNHPASSMYYMYHRKMFD